MAISIKVKGEKLPEPVELPPPGERRGTVLKEKGQPLPSMRVYIKDDVLKGMQQRAKDAGDFEVRRYVDVTAQVPALKAESARAQLTFSNEAQKALHEAMDRQSAGKLVL